MVVAMGWIRPTRTQATPGNRSGSDIRLGGCVNHLVNDRFQCFRWHLNPCIQGQPGFKTCSRLAADAERLFLAGQVADQETVASVNHEFDMTD